MRKIIFVISFVMSLFLMTLNTKALSYTDNALKTRKQCSKYELAKANSDGSITHLSCHNDYTSAKTAMDTNSERDLIIINEFNNPTRVVDAKYGILRVEMVGNSHTWESKDKVLYTFAAKLLGTIIYNRSKNEGQQ